MLRIDINLLFTVINLIIIYVIIRKLLFKPVKKIIAQREAEINKQYEDAKATQDNAAALKVQYEQALSGAQEEGSSYKRCESQGRSRVRQNRYGC